ncbi:MAG: ferrochelatase [Steroidobacteraceae bacterium]
MASATGVLVVNLGTPDAPTPAAVRRFLAEFLADPRVVDLPRLPWRLVLHGVILPLRPHRSARAYRKIWTAAGSPLMTGTQALTLALERRLAAMLPEAPTVEMGMTYGNPSIDDALRKLQKYGTSHLVVLPLYPQHSATTTAAALDRVHAALARWPVAPTLAAIEDYHADRGYIDALAASISAADKSWQHLLFSFHGIPRRYAAAGDSYGDRCQATARLVAERLALSADRWSVAFQSRVGRARWLEPYTAERLRELAAQGLKRIAVICPGFAVDCLETLEEIAIRGKASFLAAGGEEFEYIPALNDAAAHVDCLARRVVAESAP